MESHETIEKLPLVEMECFTADQLRLFNSYNIFTIGHLLSATKGYTNTSLFEEMDPSGELLEHLMEMIPAELIEKYRSWSKAYKTGLLKEPDHEEEQDDQSL